MYRSSNIFKVTSSSGLTFLIQEQHFIQDEFLNIIDMSDTAVLSCLPWLKIDEDFCSEISSQPGQVNTYMKYWDRSSFYGIANFLIIPKSHTCQMCFCNAWPHVSPLCTVPHLHLPHPPCSNIIFTVIIILNTFWNIICAFGILPAGQQSSASVIITTVLDVSTNWSFVSGVLNIKDPPFPAWLPLCHLWYIL